jgi:C-terminal processing protease CtpA/Prc
VVDDFNAAFAEIRQSEALILDVRENGGGSSGVGWTILGYLTDKPLQSTQWRTRDYRPAYRAWGRMEKWYGEGSWELAARGPDPYRQPVVVLTGAHTYSAAEDFRAGRDTVLEAALRELRRAK